MTKFELFQRAFKDLWHYGKRAYIYTLIASVCTSSLPFVSFFYMSQMVVLLTQGKTDDVMSLIYQYVIWVGVAQLVNAWVEPMCQQETDLLDRRLRSILPEKMLRMQYHYADNALTHQKLNYLQIASMSRQSNIILINVRILHIIPLVIQLGWALVLLAPLWQFEGVIPVQWQWINSWWIWVIFILIIGAMMMIQLYGGQKVAEFFSKISPELQRVNTVANYEYNLLATTEVGQEARQYKQAQRLVERWLDEFILIETTMAKLNLCGLPIHLIVVGINQMLHFVIYGLVGIRVLVGALPVGYIIQLSSAIGQLLNTLPGMIQMLLMMFSDPEALQEYYDFLALPDEEVKGSLPVEKRLDNQYKLSASNLSFTYPSSDQPTLKNISIDFEVGKTYAIVGENGSGKTTFIKLLMRLYPPSEGEVRLNQIDAQKYDLSQYFSLYSVVFQDFSLLGLPLGANLSVAPEYEEGLAMQYLKEVGLEDLLEKLPNGLETHLGTDFDNSGVSVSGGQAQKIAMARALYKDAPIMILDEPTAALDPISEFEVYQKFNQITQNKTAFFISHRLSSCRFCDEILVFDQGSIIQRGPHDELVNQEGKYQELWTAQAQYYA